MNALPIEEEGTSSSGDEPSEILPEEPEITQQDQSDDLTPLDNPDERFSNEEFGVKNVRQTGTIPETLTSSEVVISDKLLALATSTDGSGDLQFASSTQSSFDSVEAIRSSTVDDESSRIVIVDGQEFKVKATDGLQRGVDEEDDRKASRKSNTHLTEQLTTISDELASSTTESAQTTSRGMVSEAFDTVYYEPATEEPLSDVSKETFRIEDMKTSRPLTSSEIISIYEQESMLKQGTVGPMLTSDEIIAQYEEAMFKLSTEGAPENRDNDVSLVIQSQDQFTEEPEFEGSSSNPSAFSSSPFSVAEIASSTTEAIVENTSKALDHVEEDILDDRDKNPEFPEQLDDYSLHSQMQAEEAKSRGLPRDHQSDDKPLAALTELEVTNGPPAEFAIEVSSEPIVSSSEVVDSSSESSRHLHIFNKGQERSPGEPFLVPEWERNSTTLAPSIIKFDRRDSLILLPVKALEEKTQGPLSTFESSTSEVLHPHSTSGPPSSVSSEDLLEDGSTTEHHFINEVSSVESRSNGDEFNFGEDLFGNVKLNKFLRMPGDIFRYRKRMMDS